MKSFEDLRMRKQLNKVVQKMGFENPTPIQSKAFNTILSGKDMVGIAQTGTGKTNAYLLPILEELKYSVDAHPRVLILVPTRELVLQVVENVKQLSEFMNVRVFGVFGGTSINTQTAMVSEGSDVIVATPGRLYDMALSRALKLTEIKKLVIDEVDVMLDLGFRFQLTNIFEVIPEKRQNIMFSATMTDDVEALIDDYFIKPKKISVAISGTPLENIEQSCYAVPNFYTKAGLLIHLLQDREEFEKVLVFVSNKKNADRLFEKLEETFGDELGIIHSNKTQNYRIRAIEDFDAGNNRILITTDVMARGLDLDKISHVINVDTPRFPENYMHRIGRTGRAQELGKSILLFTEKEQDDKEVIEALMERAIPEIELPEEVTIEEQLLPEERPKEYVEKQSKNKEKEEGGASFHEKKDKNKKVNLGGSYHRELKKKYTKPKSRGDKNFNRRFKKK
jgi:ATP-dependent RNA helicase RhlE